MCAAADEKAAAPVFACNLKAISAAERPRYNDLVKRIRMAIRDRSEIANGYAFKLDSKQDCHVAQRRRMGQHGTPLLPVSYASARGIRQSGRLASDAHRPRRREAVDTDRISYALSDDLI
jgi:hypothetical protein